MSRHSLQTWQCLDQCGRATVQKKTNCFHYSFKRVLHQSPGWVERPQDVQPGNLIEILNWCTTLKVIAKLRRNFCYHSLKWHLQRDKLLDIFRNDELRTRVHKDTLFLGDSQSDHRKEGAPSYGWIRKITRRNSVCISTLIGCRRKKWQGQTLFDGVKQWNLFLNLSRINCKNHGVPHEKA